MWSTRPDLVHDLLDERARHTPDAVAVSQAELSWTYEQLRQLSLGYARWLSAKEVGRGDRVLIVAPHAAVSAALVYAVSRVGALYVIVSDQLKLYVLRHIAADCEPAIVLVEAQPAAHLLDVFGAAVSPVPAWQAILAEPDPSGALPVQPCLSVDPVSLIYTSGSTAMPKAVVSAHREILYAANAIASRLCYQQDDRVFCCLPMSFDYGLYQLFLACLAGATLVVGEAGDGGPPLLKALVRSRATIFPALPTLATVLTRLAERSSDRPANLRMITNTGAALSPALVDRLGAVLPDAVVVPMFGLTECKRATITPLDQIGARPGSAGTALPGTEIYVVDEHGKRLPAGEVGELVVRGPTVMSGYWRAPELTEQRFRRDEHGARLLHCGDLCRVDADGHLYFMGRRDDLYKQNGIRMSGIEVEAAALDIPGVSAAALLPPDGERGAILVVISKLAAESVLDELAARLEPARLPAECRTLNEFPLAPNGKVDKRALVELVREGKVERVPA